MSRFGLSVSISVLGSVLLAAQLTAIPGDVIRVGPGVTPPRLLHKVDPVYSPDARSAQIQGTVILQLIVDERGRPDGITVLSPLGFGLDERAVEAVEQWEFEPGTKDGKPVKILATAEINFRFPELWFNEKTERHRTSFNIAIQSLNRPGIAARDVDRAVISMQKLSEQGFPPAMFVVGAWEIKGDHIAKNLQDGLTLVQKAAAKQYGPALYDVALRRIEGRDLLKDFEKGLAEMREAATLGSPDAQFFLASRYEKGNGVPLELDRARRYFRLCAAQGIPMCQFRLGTLLLEEPNRPERDYVQAVAWFELAGERGLGTANDIAAREAPRLTLAQTTWVNTLKTQLVHK